MRDGDRRVDDVVASVDDLRRLEDLAVDLARGAGRIVHDDRPQTLTLGTKSSETDVVTEMDARSEQYLRDRLSRERPDDAVFGEEQAYRAGTSGLTWVLDPIDGTVNYLYGGDEYAVSVAVVVGDPASDGAWQPVAGAVHQPASGRTYHAHAGGGAYLSVGAAEPVGLRVGQVTQLGLTLLGTGFGYQAERRREQARVLVELLPRVRDIRRAGSAALDLCSVAAGRLDAYYERGVNAWDIAAGWLVVTEAGGDVCGVRSPRPDAAGAIACGPGLRSALVDAVVAASEGSAS